MHIAQEVHALGHASTIQGAFDKYIGSGKKAFVRKQTLPIEEAVDLIHEADGLAFVAHPGLGRIRDDLPRLLGMPFDGIEAYHSKHSPGEAEAFTLLARERDLLIAGGSDCHGMAKNAPDMGKVQVPYAVYEAICERLDRS
jgi:predicted metal-dependent phosphoesterase TrpH